MKAAATDLYTTDVKHRILLQNVTRQSIFDIIFKNSLVKMALIGIFMSILFLIRMILSGLVGWRIELGERGEV